MSSFTLDTSTSVLLEPVEFPLMRVIIVPARLYGVPSIILYTSVSVAFDISSKSLLLEELLLFAEDADWSPPEGLLIVTGGACIY